MLSFHLRCPEIKMTRSYWDKNLLENSGDPDVCDGLCQWIDEMRLLDVRHIPLPLLEEPQLGWCIARDSKGTVGS
jgi:hypothetical protein